MNPTINPRSLIALEKNPLGNEPIQMRLNQSHCQQLCDFLHGFSLLLKWVYKSIKIASIEGVKPNFEKKKIEKDPIFKLKGIVRKEMEFFFWDLRNGSGDGDNMKTMDLSVVGTIR